jgi:hypothetical protein
MLDDCVHQGAETQYSLLHSYNLVILEDFHDPTTTTTTTTTI